MVVMRQNDGCGIDFERFLDDLPRIDGGTVDRAPEQLIEPQYAVPVVEKQAAKQLMVEMSHAGLEEGLRVSRTSYGLTAGQRLRVVATGEFRKGLQDTQSRATDAAARQDVRRLGMQQRPKAAKTMQKLNGHIACPAGATAGQDQGAK